MSDYDKTLSGGSGTAEVAWVRGQPGVLSIAGTFGGGTVTFHWKTTGGTWVPFKEPENEAADLSATAARAIAFEKLPAVAIRATLAGATNANLEFSAIP